MFSRTKIENLTKAVTFSIIFKPETNMRELDLVAGDQETKETWVSVIRHLVARLAQITNQQSHDMSVSIVKKGVKNGPKKDDFWDRVFLLLLHKT